MDYSNKFLFLMSRAMNRIKYYSIIKFNEGGITVTPSQMGILFLLKKADSLPMSVLSTALAVDNSTITRHADKLIKSELVERIRDNSDRRILKLKITETGIMESRKAAKIANRVNADIIAGFTNDEIRIFSKVLTGIIQKLDSNALEADNE